MSEASTSYKKQDGKLSVSKDGKTVSWRPAVSSTPPLSIAVSEITNLQQTPEKSAKVSIKIVVQRSSTAAAENHTFTFTSATSARTEQSAITGLLRKAIEAARAQNGSTPAPADDGGGQSAAMAIAQAVSAGARAEESTFDDARLMSNTELQKSLLSANPALRQRFDQALREKPETITISQFSTQFWASRVHLLRAHAVEKSQSQGTYNVLSEVKPKNVDGTTRLNLSKEQIQLIFNQHPLVKRVYNENVPQLSEMEFWSRFFVSRLFKKLKGEKITETDATDPKLDRYLNFDEEADRARQLVMAHVPHFIDLEGNEQNHSQRLGNRPDWTMQPNSHDKVPILRVLNSMSEKMLADVAPIDIDPHAPSGMDEDAYKELQLRDLQRHANDNRVILKIKDQRHFFSVQGGMVSSSASLYAKHTPGQVLSKLRNDLESISNKQDPSGSLNLEAAIGVLEDSDSEEDDDDPKKKWRVGGKPSRNAATAQIMGAIRQRHLHTDDQSTSNSAPATQASKYGLSNSAFDSLAMVHNTTVEFLHYFWTVFLSGDPDRAVEVQKLVETLDKSLDRIAAVAESAEKERMVRVEKAKKQIEDYMQRTGKRRKFDANSIKGGARAVNMMTAPIVRAIKAATDQYRRAYETQMAQMAQLQTMQ